MKALRQSRYGGAEVLEWLEVPLPVAKPGEVLVRVVAAAANPKDVLIRKGRMRWATGNRLPRGVGFDFAGVVEASGEEVFGMLNGFAGRSHAEYLCAAADEWAPRPRNIPLQDCTALPLAGQTALQALRDLGRVGSGSRVLINGASGGVGVLAVQIAKILGAEVTAVSSAANAGLLRELGADVLVDYAQTPVASIASKFEVIFDVFGNQRYAGIKPLLAARGRYITTVPSLANVRDHLLSALTPGKQARLVVVKSKRGDLAWLREQVEAGRLRAVIDRRYPMREAAEAHRYLESKRARGKVLLLP